MAQPTGWYATRFPASTTSYCIDFINMVNYVLIKNEDAAIAVWFLLGDQTMPQPVAAAGGGGVLASFRLAAGESWDCDKLRVKYIAVISESGTPNVKIMGLGLSPELTGT